MSQTEPTQNGEGEQDDEPQVVYPQSGPGPEEMANEYLPEGEDWEAKTVLDTRDPGAIAALSQLETIYPEVGELQPMVDDALTHFFKSRTSVGGASRDEYSGILRSMFGGGSKEDVKEWVDLFGVNED